MALVSCTGCGDQVGNKNLKKVTKNVCEYMVDNVSEATVGESGGDWTIFALKNSGTDVASDKYYDSYYDNVRGQTKANKGELSTRSYTTYERISMALTAMGKDPTKVEGYDLTSKVDDYKAVTYQGYNAEMFALISSNYCGFKLKNEKKYISDILGCQMKNGAMTLDGKTADVDMTAMGVQALSYYKTGNKKCADAIKKALSYLQKQQKSDGSYGNAESTAQVIIALGTLKKDPTAEKNFSRDGKDLGDGLMVYYKDKAFEHKKGEGVNMMATEQGLLALDAIRLGKEGKSIYEK